MRTAYRRYLLIFLCAVCVYAPTSTLLWARYQYELFPFAPWELFSHVPNQHHDFGMRILAVDGQPLDGAPYLETLKGIAGEPYSINAHTTIQTLGQHLENGDMTSAADARTLLEGRYLAGAVVVYAIYARDSFPLARWRNEGFIHEVELARFSTETP